MNLNHSPQPDNRKKVIAFIVLCLLFVGCIIYMKHQSDSGRSLLPVGGGDTARHAVAVPDTTSLPDVAPAERETVIVSTLSDTILGRDKRQPYEAGYEDGYAAGCDDGADKADHASYDETNNFNTPADRENYVRGYREGYAKGYDDGGKGKQFNI